VISNQGHGITKDALDVLCAQLRRDVLAIVKFLVLRCLWLATPRSKAVTSVNLLASASAKMCRSPNCRAFPNRKSVSDFLLVTTCNRGHVGHDFEIW